MNILKAIREYQDRRLIRMLKDYRNYRLRERCIKYASSYDETKQRSFSFMPTSIIITKKNSKES